MKQFSTALAHELRTPLAALRGETELALMEARSPEDYQRGLASQIEEFDRLTRLINQLLTLARAEAGEIPLARAPVDLGRARHHCRAIARTGSRARDLTLTCESDAGVVITGDAGWLERLLLNLIDNAIKFTPRDGRSSSASSGTADRRWSKSRTPASASGRSRAAHLRAVLSGGCPRDHRERRRRAGAEPGTVDRGSARGGDRCGKCARAGEHVQREVCEVS
jgi:light-regulated signal transduction histidine kinase (bacteriophytochrome)